MTSNPARAILLAPILFVMSCGGGGGGSASSIGSKRARRNHPKGAQQSTNWSGYGIAGAPAGFNAVRGTWVVPAIAPSKNDTASSTWAGIGGGCADPPTCNTVDPTLIQAGTEADNSGGSTQYFAWWEAIPAPSVPLMGGPLRQGSFDVQPGDSITVSISSDLVIWTIDIQNVRSGSPHWTFTTTVPYTAAGLTAEWIEEAPLTVGSGGAGQIAMSNFNRVEFDALTANAANPNLAPADAIALVNGAGKIIAQPSAPGSSGDSFAVCFGSLPCN
jgi:hypothetical protein